MPFELREVKGSDFPEVITAMWYTYENPEQQFYRIFFPLNSTGKVDRAAAVEESIERYRGWDASDPNSYWQMVVDTDNGDKCVGAALWNIHTENPYKGPPQRYETYWHPEGGQRAYATKAFWQHNDALRKYAQRPHLYLGIIYVLPEYERKGVGSIIMNWGIKRAQELDVELWLHAWKYGKGFYEKHGFAVIDHYLIKPELGDREPDEAWNKCVKEWENDLEDWVMYRPNRGPYVEGKSPKPWE